MPTQPRPPTAFDVTPTDGDLIVTDIHGDFDGLISLLRESNHNFEKNRIFTIGDNVDRGPQSLEVLNFLKENAVTSIMGNHDWAHVRYARHLVENRRSGKKIPMTLSTVMQDTVVQLGENYVELCEEMGTYPLYLPFEDSQGQGYLLHGGIDPFHAMEEQQPDKMLVRRYHPSPSIFLPNETSEHPYWQRAYTGNLGTILHGHMASPSVHFHNNSMVYSLDGGGVYGSMVPWGGTHRAIRLGDRRVFEVSGSKTAEANLVRLGEYYRGNA